MLFGLLLSGISKLFQDPTAGDYSYPEGTADPHNPFENLMYRITGQGLTGQQVASNKFAHDEAELAFQRSLQADSTKYQRSVADMQAAGINPMLAAGGVGGSSVSSPAATPSADSGANLGSILSFIIGLRNASIQKKAITEELKIKKDVAASEIAKNNAEAGNKIADTESKKIDTQFKVDTLDLRKILLGDEHTKNEVGVENIRQLTEQSKHYSQYLEHEQNLIDEMVLTESAKRAMYRASAREANMSAEYKGAMLELDQDLVRAQTEEKRAEVELTKIEARFKNGVYNEQYIKDICAAAHMDANIKTIIYQYKKGDYSSASKELQKVFRKLEKEAKVPAYSVSSAYFGTSENGPAAAAALPY